MLKNIVTLLILATSCSFLAFSSDMDNKRPSGAQPETETAIAQQKPRKSVVNYARALVASVFGYMTSLVVQNNSGHQGVPARLEPHNILKAVTHIQDLQTIIADYVGLDLVHITTIKQNQPLQAMAISADGKYVMQVSEGALREWDIEAGQVKSHHAINNNYWKRILCSQIVYCPNGKHIAFKYLYRKNADFSTVPDDHKIEIIDRETWELVQTRTLRSNGDSVTIQYSPDGKSLFVNNTEFLELDAQTLETRKVWWRGMHWNALLSPDGKQLIHVDNYRPPRLEIFDMSGPVTEWVNTINSEPKYIVFPDNYVMHIKYLEDYIVYIAGDDKKITFLSRDDYKKSNSFDLLKTANMLEISRNGLIAVGSPDGTINFYRLYDWLLKKF